MEIQGQDVLKIKKTNIVRKYKEGAAEGFAGKSTEFMLQAKMLSQFTKMMTFTKT